MDKWIQLQSSDGVDNLFPVGKMDLLWTNATPNTNFGEQYINLDTTGYKSFIGVFAWGVQTGLDVVYSTLLIPAKNLNCRVSARIASTDKFRQCRVEDTRVWFSDCSSFPSYAQSSSGVVNSTIIPYKIYGIK